MRSVKPKIIDETWIGCADVRDNGEAYLGIRVPVSQVVRFNVGWYVMWIIKNQLISEQKK